MRRGAGIAGNPVLIGAATVLVVLVAVFLAYNANRGLPFVPTYELKAEVPSAANLVVGNDVRIGGSRVGLVSDIAPKRRDDGTTIAVLSLTMERSVAPLPRDSTVLIRPRSALGLKYVEITRGTGERGYDDGATMPLAAATPTPVEFDEVLSTFDEKTRAAVAANTTGFGDALAGRGESLNTAIGALRPWRRTWRHRGPA
jgi:ABC-type transporter Mla subunit MlaD